MADLGFVGLGLMSAVRTSLPTTALARRVLADAEASGYADQELSAMFNALSRLGQEDAVNES